MSATETSRLFHELIEYADAAPSVEKQTPLSVDTAYGAIRAFASADPPRIGLVIPTGEDRYSKLKSDRKSSAIQIIKLISDGAPCIRICLNDRNLLGTFSVFCDEYLSSVKDQHCDPIELAYSQLSRWRRLFKEASTRDSELTRDEEIGLLCELEVLLSLARQGYENPVLTWLGPSKSPHDFELRDQSIECKATLSTVGLRIQVHGTQQLAATSDKPLVLAVRRYREDPYGEISIPKMIELLLNESNVESEDLISTLHRLKVPLPGDQLEVRFGSYTPEASFEFDVVEGFPRLTHIGPEHRVQSLQYTLDLSGPESVPGYRTQLELLPKTVR